jgi:hypothetical protein
MNKSILIAAMVLALAGPGRTEENLVPSKPTGRIYNYFCTWAAQAYTLCQGADHVDMDLLMKGDGTPGMHEERLKDKSDGWLGFFPKVRGDLWFLTDDGYYEVRTTKEEGMASMVVDTERFPSCKGKSPAERLKTIAEMIKGAGWHGMGLWSRGYPEDDKIAAEKLEWSKTAGIGYWKIDTGDLPMNYLRLRAGIDPSLILEYSVWAHGVFTGNGETGMAELLPKTVFPQQHAYLRGADVVRIYDVDQPLGQITALLRTAGLLKDAWEDPAATAVINVEDHVSIAAGLACSAGILRFPTTGKRPDGDPDIFLAGPRHVKRRMDEVVRMLRWQRIAPPLPANALAVAIDGEGIADTWNLVRGDTWSKKLGPVSQSAPARISRGLPLAEVRCDGSKPFVLACRHPHGGPVAVTTLGRFDNAKGYRIPLADVSVEVGDLPETVAIFGRYASLTLRSSQPVGPVRILAQDLAADASRDITSDVKIDGKQITIPGNLIESIGLSAATHGDESDPGLVLRINRTP